MIDYITNSCGYVFNLVGPASVEEYNAGGGDCLKDAVVNGLIFRGGLPDWQKALVSELESAHPDFPRVVDATATAKAKARAKDPSTVADVLEKNTSYILRCTEEFGVEQALADKAATSITLSSAPRERTAAEATVAKKWLTKAQEIAERDEASLTKTLAKLREATPAFELTYDEEGAIELAPLAKAVKAWAEANDI